jgi:hypothetical protein
VPGEVKNIRRPGGTLPNPNAGQPGAPAMIPCKGVSRDHLPMAKFHSQSLLTIIVPTL